MSTKNTKKPAPIAKTTATPAPVTVSLSVPSLLPAYGGTQAMQLTVYQAVHNMAERLTLAALRHGMESALARHAEQVNAECVESIVS